MSEIIKKFKDLAGEVKILMLPSPYRLCSDGTELIDLGTYLLYRRWLESEKNLDEYFEHQKAGFPLFPKNTLSK